MAKEIVTYVCNQCGYVTSKLMGRCPSCAAWGSLEERREEKNAKTGEAKVSQEATPLSEIRTDRTIRFKTGMGELDRVLGGGLVEGSLVLIGGDPGIGKSTLMLQISRYLSAGGKKVLYVSGEESLSQIKLRAVRLKTDSPSVSVLAETDTDAIVHRIQQDQPDFAIIDSIQTMYKNEIGSVPGSVAQVREACGAFMNLAKKTGIPIFIVGHVTKDGAIAGPKILEHMVDTVLYFEGNGDHTFRLLRAVKNRFGATNEVAVFEMNDNGLTEVTNPSELFVSRQSASANVPGSVILASVNGTLPVLVEVQALVSRSEFEGRTRCIVSGMDGNRVSLLCAVLQNRLGINLTSKDVYTSVAGGLRIFEPALDLAALLAVYTAARNIIMPHHTCVFGEIGLAGEVRGVAHAEKRIGEAVKTGLRHIILSKDNQDSAKPFLEDGVEIVCVQNIRQAAEWVAAHKVVL